MKVCPRCKGTGEIKCKKCGAPSVKAKGLCRSCHFKDYWEKSGRNKRKENKNGN